MQYGRYKIIDELGKGSMGVVYKAYDPQIEREIALKVLRAERMSNSDFLLRFMKEARAIGRMSHQNIVTVFDVGDDQGTVYIAMEFLDGVPLNKYAKDNTLSLDDIIKIGIQIAECLDYAHSRGIVHRDIKPPNIIVTPGAKVKLTDFGIAHIEDPEASFQTQAGEILGTPNYMSPEQVIGKKVDGRSDLYSLGLILYELSTGVRPFAGDNLASIFHAIASKTPVLPEEINPSIKKEFSDILMRSLSKDPAERYSTGQEMADALKALLKPEPSAVAVPEKKKSPVAIIASVILILAIAAIGFYFSSAKKQPSIEMGTLKIESVPKGAQIYVDGALKGTSPLAVSVPLGGHEVRLSMPNYYEWEAQVQVEKIQKEPLKIELMPADK